MSSSAVSSIWETIAVESAGESPLWGAVLRRPDQREEVPVFSPLGADRYALGLESIYEGYLLHYGRPRLFAPADRNVAILLGDYLYAHGLVRIAALAEVDVVADLAELLSVCAQLRADRRGGDGAAWAATVAFLGRDDGRLAAARALLREQHDPGGLARLAESEAGADALARALSLHQDRVN